MLEDKILTDYKVAMKSKDNLKSSTLSFLRAQIKNVCIDKKKEKLDDSDVIAIIKKQVKQRQDSIENFKSGGRQDLVDKEQKELKILESYLPKELSKEELAKMVDDEIKNSGATSMKDMGKIMKEVLAKASGRADNKLVSDLVRLKLENK